MKPRRLSPVAWATIIASLAYLALAAGLSAHEYTRADGTAVDASWIKVKAPWCCGKEDCRPVLQQDVVFTPAGWRVRGMNGAIPINLVRQSDPGKGPWVCDNRVNGYRDDIRCLFLPGSRM